MLLQMNRILQQIVKKCLLFEQSFEISFGFVEL